ncbi:MAG: hypothetical protein ACQESC_01785 [Nanobdellota archaeon]
MKQLFQTNKGQSEGGSLTMIQKILIIIFFLAIIIPILITRMDGPQNTKDSMFDFINKGASPSNSLSIDDENVAKLADLDGYPFVVDDRGGVSTGSCNSDKKTCTYNGLEILTDADGNGMNCFDSTLFAYKKAGFEWGEFDYCLHDDYTSDDFDDGCSNTQEITKDMLAPGDIISFNYDGDKHSVIFLGWADEKRNKANILNWVGRPEYDELPNAFTNTVNEDAYEELIKDKALKTFVIEEYDLRLDASNKDGMVYAISKPD